MSGSFTGATRLTRLALRRDRVQLPVWILSTVALGAFASSAIDTQYPTEADRLAVLRVAVDTPGLLMFRAAPTGTSDGQMTVFGILAFLALMAGFMSTFAVVRHTRQNEETGRAEMIGATAVGRHATLTAALAVVVGANIALAALIGLAFAGNGESAASSFAAGAAVGSAGIAFAAIAAAAAQLTQGARAANGIAATAVGAAYLVRGLADAFGEVRPDGYTMTSAWPAWLSPIGWTMQVRPYAGDRWWVLTLPLALFAVMTAVSFALTARRDVGMGLFADRPGPTRASSALLSPLGLAWRLQRGTVLGWAVTITVFGLIIGSIANAVKDQLAVNENVTGTLNDLAGGGGHEVMDAFFAAMMATIGALVAGYLVQALLRARVEEASGRAEVVLATATGRLTWLGSHVVVATAGAVAMLGLAALSIGLVYGASVHDLSGQIGQLAGTAYLQLPAALVLAGLALTLFGLLPRVSVGLTWFGFALSFVTGPYGALLGVPEAVRELSPFSHIPAVPADATAAPIVLMTAVALALGVAGLALFRRRNLAA
ncbi:anibiotic ABC transporter [Micromonospora sp. WMMD812]|uniref:ABC transporter permease n=1 Tax=Micromonospora sp. WMMD812 TaxID=3015152 RepID=UPI00248C7782|nr:anibiotic ABC transporter [Micromonospora sp. WMMD812]WBB65393.1 anibiotic ABC transporter [Micromonospora sp. WMMD812]